MKCIYCNNNCIKKGVRQNVQKYYCKNCSKYQQSVYLKKRCTGISTTTVLSKIRFIASGIVAPDYFAPKGNYEMDEMHTSIWKNNIRTETYIAYAIHKESKRVVNFTVGSRNSETLSLTINKILENYPRRIQTDKWVAYPCIIPSEIYVTTRRKINQIERYNLTLR